MVYKNVVVIFVSNKCQGLVADGDGGIRFVPVPTIGAVKDKNYQL